MRRFNNADTFSKAVTFIEFEKSGNPQEKYRSGGSDLALFLAEALKSGTYISYIDQVLSETEERKVELEKQIESYSRATFKLSPEHANPEEYRRLKLLEASEEEN